MESYQQVSNLSVGESITITHQRKQVMCSSYEAMTQLSHYVRYTECIRVKQSSFMYSFFLNISRFPNQVTNVWHHTKMGRFQQL